jgi:hypothetical protein
MKAKRVVLLLLVLTAAPLSGCVSGGGDGGDGGGGSGADIRFTEHPDTPNELGVRVASMGGYDAVWVELGNVEGGYQINEESEVPNLKIGVGPKTGLPVGDTCFKESHDVECMYQGEDLDNAPDVERFFEFNGGMEAYGLSGGEKTLIKTREP